MAFQSLDDLITAKEEKRLKQQALIRWLAAMWRKQQQRQGMPGQSAFGMSDPWGLSGLDMTGGMGSLMQIPGAGGPMGLTHATSPAIMPPSVAGGFFGG